MGINSGGISLSVGSYGNASKIGKSSISNFNIDLSDYNEYIGKEVIGNYEADLDYTKVQIPEQTEIEKKGTFVRFMATAAVALTSFESGVIDVYESAVDGATWVLSTGAQLILKAGSAAADLFGADDFSNKIDNLTENLQEETMDFIGYDAVGEFNKAFYENTELGQKINDQSYMKFDSKEAGFIQGVGTGVMDAIVATTLTVATGGAAIPALAAGFVIKAGSSAEDKFSDITNRDYWEDSLMIGIDGGIGALEYYTLGKAGSKAYKSVKKIADTGSLTGDTKKLFSSILEQFKNGSLKTTFKENFGKVFKTATIDTLKDSGVYKGTCSVVINDIKSGLETDEWNIGGMAAQVLFVFGANFVANFASNLFKISYEYTDNQLKNTKSATKKVEDKAKEIVTALPNLNEKIANNAEISMAVFEALESDTSLPEEFKVTLGLLICASLSDVNVSDDLQFNDYAENMAIFLEYCNEINGTNYSFNIEDVRSMLADEELVEGMQDISSVIAEEARIAIANN